MGYPMTWKRILNRNGLQDGDYGHAPQRHQARVNIGDTIWISPAVWNDEVTDRLATSISAAEDMARHRRDRITEYEGAFKMLAGDIRRLELDAVDEAAIARQIAHRTEIDLDIVAAVLREFMSI